MNNRTIVLPVLSGSGEIRRLDEPFVIELPFQGALLADLYYHANDAVLYASFSPGNAFARLRLDGKVLGIEASMPGTAQEGICLGPSRALYMAVDNLAPAEPQFGTVFRFAPATWLPAAREEWPWSAEPVDISQQLKTIDQDRGFPDLTFECSGITWHPERGTLFVVSDDGPVAEVSAAGEVLNYWRMSFFDREAITYCERTGTLFLWDSGRRVIDEFDPKCGEIVNSYNVRHLLPDDPDIEALE